MHSSSTVDVYLEIGSDPVIEHCSGIRFAAYPSSLVRVGTLQVGHPVLCSDWGSSNLNGSITTGQKAFYCERLLSYFTDTVAELEFTTRGETRKVMACLCSSRSGTAGRARPDVVGTLLAVGEWFANMSAFFHLLHLLTLMSGFDYAHEALGSFPTILRMVSSLHSMYNQ